MQDRCGSSIRTSSLVDPVRADWDHRWFERARAPMQLQGHVLIQLGLQMQIRPNYCLQSLGRVSVDHVLLQTMVEVGVPGRHFGIGWNARTRCCSASASGIPRRKASCRIMMPLLLGMMTDSPRSRLQPLLESRHWFSPCWRPAQTAATLRSKRPRTVFWQQ